MTITDFFNNNGESTFIDRLAAALNIAQSRIRIVGVWSGSVMIEAQIVHD